MRLPVGPVPTLTQVFRSVAPRTPNPTDGTQAAKTALGAKGESRLSKVIRGEADVWGRHWRLRVARLR